MRPHAARSAVPTALLSLLCAAAASCITPGMFRSRDRGGVYMLLAVQTDAPALADAVRQTAQVIEARCSALRVHCQAERQGGEDSNLVRLSVSGAQDLERVKAVLLAEGRLELRPVVSAFYPMPLTTYPTREAAEKAAGGRYDVVPFEDKGANVSFLTVEREPVVTGLDLRSANAVSLLGGENDYQINFTLRPEGAARFGAWTSANVNRYLAIMLNGKVRSAPFIRGQITDNGEINGNFNRQQAEDVVLTLRSGSLPAHVEVLEEGKL